MLAWVFPLRWNKNPALQAGCWIWLCLATFRGLARFQIRVEVWEGSVRSVLKSCEVSTRLTQSTLPHTQALDSDCQEHGKQLLTCSDMWKTCSNTPYRLLEQWEKKHQWKNKWDTATSLFMNILSWTYKSGEIPLSAELERLCVKTKLGPLGFSYLFFLLRWKIISSNIIGPDHKISICLNFLWVEITVIFKAGSIMRTVWFIDYWSAGELH